MTTDKPDGIVWQEPPPIKRAGGSKPKFVPLAEELRHRPGHWALVGNYAGYGGLVVTKLRELGCEVTARRTGNGRVALYARWPEDKP